MVRNTLVGVVLLVCLAALASAVPQRGDDSKEEPDFTGKVLIVSVKEPARGSVVQRAKVRRLGARAFLVGEYVKRRDDDLIRDVPMWFPIDDIIYITEFPNVDEVRKFYIETGKWEVSAEPGAAVNDGDM